MKFIPMLIALLALFIGSCATVDSPSEGPTEEETIIEVDGDFSDWRALGISPVVLDPEGDALGEFSSGDMKAMYYRKVDSWLYFYVHVGREQSR